MSEGLGRVGSEEKPEQTSMETSGHSSPSMLRSRGVIGTAAKKFNHQGRFWVIKSSESRTVRGFRAWSLLGTSLTDPGTGRAATATANLQGAHQSRAGAPSSSHVENGTSNKECSLQL